MKRISLILAVMALASVSASAKDIQINLSLDTYCDAFELTLSGTPQVYLDGVHDYSNCGGLPNVLVGGFRHTIPHMGAVFDLSDPTWGYIEDLPYGFEFLTNANTKEPCVWAFYLNYPGTPNVLFNSGTCTYFTDVVARPDVKGLPPAYKGASIK